MDTFYTITDQYTQHTNSRSQRFPTEAEAVAAAEQRITSRPHDNSWVIVMQAVKVVKPKPTTRPVTVVPIAEA
jgi:hypothetical protein